MSDDSDSDDEPSGKRSKSKGSKGGSSCHQVSLLHCFFGVCGYHSSVIIPSVTVCRKR